MADVCIVYARKDACAIPPALEALLGNTWSVWWDKKIAVGDYRQAIERELRSAGCIVPVWSEEARQSLTLHDELEIARDANIPIVPIRIHDVNAPLGYGAIQAVDILLWQGEPGRPELPRLAARIHDLLKHRQAALSRPEDLSLGRRSKLPLFFFSVSSHETEITVPTALNALNVFGAPAVLVSAYDMDGTHSKSSLKLVERCKRDGALVLLDSGNYEKTRRGDNEWKMPRFQNAVRQTPHDFAFCYDKLSPPARLSEIVDGVVKAVERDAKLTSAQMLPIVHLPRVRGGDYRVDLAPEVVRRVSEKLRPALIAIPERELGPGVFARASTIAAIRERLKSLYYYQPIHVLGTGTPITIALLVAAGADSFDGLEWCRYAADADSATLHHFQHFDLFRYQAQVADSPITVEAMSDEQVNFAGRTVFHNLDFYVRWLARLRLAVRDEKRLVEFMTDLLPKGAMEQARATLPEIL